MKYIILFTDRNGTERWLYRQSHNLWGYTTSPEQAHRYGNQPRAISHLGELVYDSHIVLDGDETIEIQPVQE